VFQTEALGAYQRYRRHKQTTREESAMERDDAYRAVCETFGEYFEVHPGQVLAHHELNRDWGVSGQELELLAHQIEERAGIELSDHGRLAELRTIGELVRLIRSALRRATRVEPPLRP
jgi:hypothetical protein